MIKHLDALILCGGKGTRLREISGKAPKPMVCIGGKVFLDIMIEGLRKAGFKRIILGIGYRARLIREYYKYHPVSGVEIVFCEEKAPLGTGGAVKKARRLIKSESFFVLNGDTFSKFNAQRMLRSFRRKKAKLLILLRKAKPAKEYGLITLDSRSRICGFNEKASSSQRGFVNGGVYLFSKKVFSQMPGRARFSLEYDLFPRMCGKGLYGYKEAGPFIDIGTPERYLSAQKYLLKS
ncbi:MAG: sugar phosphate nucleotidyltransferase [Candidatus Omnitrophota bacterium]